jgi:CubicO group peptidase (beta-lactamase class C family)
MLDTETDDAITTFIDQYMMALSGKDRPDLIKRLQQIRTDARGLRDGIMVEPAEKGIRLILAAQGKEKRLLILLNKEQEKIADIVSEENPKPLIITDQNISAVFQQLETEGLAGVILLKRKGRLLISRGFGFSNEALQIKNQENTAFCIGSRPIEFTIAAIQLLDQQRKIKITDSIGRYFQNIPNDKRNITIRQLLNGQSGLPDFFHTKDDWDPDLQWISRETAIQRMMNQSLLFAPGTGREHSHAAFVLLAALIDKVSGKSYYEYLREFFLDPAGMNRTGEYGESRGLSVSDFAVGGGPMKMGVPNIPPNWGPTSWLIKGSGGMYSSLNDLLKFYEYIRSGKILDEAHRKYFTSPGMGMDGSDRGFELFSAYLSKDDQLFLFTNKTGSRSQLRQLTKALEKLISQD